MRSFALSAELGTMPPPASLGSVPTVEGTVPPHTLSFSTASAHSDPSVSSAAAAAAFCNLLPFGGGGGTQGSTGIYIGEGLPPVPSKLADRIRKWEYIDMSELLPEYWGQMSLKPAETLNGAQQPTARRPRKVTEITSWVQCFASYVGVLAGPSPEAVPELMAYLIHIVRVSQDFGGMAWVNYDMAFRRQAATTGNRQWSKINPSLYSICFAGAARNNKRCELCLSLTHESRDCALSGEGEQEVGARLSAIESAVLSLTAARPATNTPLPTPQRREICRSWNENRCTYPRCRFRHACRVCFGPRPAVECCERALAPLRPRQVPPPRNLSSRIRDSARPY